VRLDELRERPLNFDPLRREGIGWRTDDVRRALPPEPPGDPVPGGSWKVARAIALDYDFAEPSIVEGIFDRDEPLEDRTMLLILHFRGLAIAVGVRVGDVYDGERELDGRRGRVFGWNYRTLEGHVEQGQMDWQVWKFPETGEVLFRISSFSRAARVGNPLLRIGFWLVGRREQRRFLELTAARMARLTAERVPNTRGAFTPLGGGHAGSTPGRPLPRRDSDVTNETAVNEQPATAAGTGSQQGQQAAGQAKEKAQEVASQAQDRAREAAGEARGRVGQEVDRRSTEVGERIGGSAGDARSVAEELRKQGKDAPARYVEQAAERAEKVGGYLRDSDGDRILRDVEDFARRQPWAVAAGGLLLGFAASRLLKASSQERYRSSTAQRYRPSAPEPYETPRQFEPHS
jgi:uncharacterized protein DUF1990